MAGAPSDERTRVLVVGAGPAGLAAAARLVERGGARLRVRLAALGHHLGGKAASWRDSEGRYIDHGQHVVIGWYRELLALLERAGVDTRARLSWNGGETHLYEPRDQRVHTLHLRRNPIAMLAAALGYSGLTGAEKANVASFVTRNAGLFLGLQELEQFDDVCFTTLCLANGLRPSIVKTSIFLASRTAQLNWPGEISAYSMLKATREMGRDYKSARYAFVDGGMSERFWQPVLEYFARLGGEFEMMKKLTAIHVDHGRAVGVSFGEPDSGGHDQHSRHRSAFAGAIPIKPGTERVDRDFDYLITTLPATAFQELNPGDTAFWSIPAFAGVRNLRGVRPLALQIWHRAALTRRYPGALGGLDGPLPYLVDNKHLARDYREDPRYGAVLHFVGQETGFEHWSDERLLAQCLRNLRHVPGAEQLDREGVLHWQVVRHHSPDQLYFYTEPGINRFRPHARTPLANLFLAGDWVRSELDFPCMETAVRTGLSAADKVLGAVAAAA
ncbi:MAG: FAD-dependent oxidoreductase [Deltaproteobacteria bacterium]|nr:FAD-dependent oxidoreductase [Deltaproteobacteria bacterium]